MKQRSAAEIGRYNLQLQLAHPSAAVKIPREPGVLADLGLIFGAARAEVVYLHNPADKHDTHIALFLRCIEALRTLPADAGQSPGRGLRGLAGPGLGGPDADKIGLDAGLHPELRAAAPASFRLPRLPGASVTIWPPSAGGRPTRPSIPPIKPIR